MSKVIIFNGAPECGKDIAATAVAEYLQDILQKATHCEFKGQLIRLTKMIFGISDQQWDEWYTRDGKEIPRAELGGRSARGALIFVSEVVMKPNLGLGYFGEFAAKYEGDILVFSDGGFVSELQPMIDIHGFENIAVVRVRRDGCSFANDSRDYLPDGCVGTIYDIENKMKFGEIDSPEYFEYLDACRCIANNFIFDISSGVLGHSKIAITKCSAK